MESRSLFPSLTLKTAIERYATLVPVNQTDFIDHFDEVYPGKRDDSGCNSPLYGCGWYNEWYPQWNENLATATINAVQGIVDLYWTGPAPTPGPTAAPTLAPTPGVTYDCYSGSDDDDDDYYSGSDDDDSGSDDNTLRGHSIDSLLHSQEG